MEKTFSSLISILKHDPELFRKVFDSVPAGICITTDITCRDIKYNKKAAEFLRIQPGKALSHTASSDLSFKMFYKGEELSLEEMPIQRAVWQGEKVKEQEIDLFWEDGKHKTAIFSSIPLLDENGSIAGAAAVFEDVTERRELEHRLKEHQEHLEELVKKRTWEVGLSNYKLKKENFQLIEVEDELRKKNEEISIILESVTDSFFALDNEWTFTYANEEAKKYFFNEDVLGKNIWSLIPKAMGSIFWDNYYKVMLNREPAHFEAKTIYTKIWVAVHVYPFHNGISVIFQDISEKKRIEDNLRLSEEKFSDVFYKSPAMMVIRSLEGKIIEANDRFLETMGYIREEIFCSASTGIKTWLIPAGREMIIDDLSKTGSVKNFETTYISKAGKTVDVLSSIDLIEIAGEKCLILNLELEEIPDLNLEENDIKQMILNLTRNGLEAMDRGGYLTIKTFTDGQSVVLAVKDQGKGIQPEHMDKLYVPFFTTKDYGTGLGLAVCYKIAARHNAKIDLETSPDGTTFFVAFRTAETEFDL
ncbi:MAG: PAS domain S-box protein [Eubacteriales bacterium]